MVLTIKPMQADETQSSLHWTIFASFCVLFVQGEYVSFGSFIIACSVNIEAHTHFEQNFKALRLKKVLVNPPASKASKGGSVLN